MVHVNARFEIKPGCMEKFVEVVSGIVDIVRAEPGCISYELCRDLRPSPDGKTYATFVETWESEAALKAHGATPHMCRYREQVADLRVGGQVSVMEKIV